MSLNRQPPPPVPPRRSLNRSNRLHPARTPVGMMTLHWITIPLRGNEGRKVHLSPVVVIGRIRKVAVRANKRALSRFFPPSSVLRLISDRYNSTQAQSTVFDVASPLDDIQAPRGSVKSTAIALVKIDSNFLLGTTIDAIHWVAYAMMKGRIRVISRSSGDRTLLQLPQMFASPPQSLAWPFLATGLPVSPPMEAS